jgi:predicted acyl esterase
LSIRREKLFFPLIYITIIFVVIFDINFNYSSISMSNSPVSPLDLHKAGVPIFMEEMVEMRDGVDLYTRIYLPDDPANGPYPAILVRSPYGNGVPGVGPDPNDWPLGISDGYAVVTQDSRGRFYSEGLDRFYLDEGEDGYDTIEWIAGRNWCDGNVGMYGASADGVLALLAAAEKPPHLKAIAPYSSSANVLGEFVYPGGAFSGDSFVWSLFQTTDWKYETSGLSEVPGGHIQLRGLTLSQFITYRNFLNDYVLGDPLLVGEGLMQNLGWHILGIGSNATASDWWMKLPLSEFSTELSTLQPEVDRILDHPSEDAWRSQFNVYNDIDVPALLLTGWYDIFLKSQFELFEVLQDRGIDVKLRVEDNNHYDLEGDSIQLIRWFDFFLKGEQNGIINEPAISYYDRADSKWKYANEWPPKIGESTKKYYFHENGVLNTEKCAVGEDFDSYSYDPMDPVLTKGGNTIIVSLIKLADQRPVVDGRDDIMSYTTQPLTESREFIGPVKVVLSASSNQRDTDFTAKIIDVHPNGKLALIADGIIRARYRNSMANPVFMSGNPAIKYDFTIDLGDIQHVFKAGHSIRVDISSSNFPKYDRNLNTDGTLYHGTAMNVAQNRIYHDAIRLSYLEVYQMPKIPDPPPLKDIINFIIIILIILAFCGLSNYFR